MKQRLIVIAVTLVAATSLVDGESSEKKQTISDMFKASVLTNDFTTRHPVEENNVETKTVTTEWDSPTFMKSFALQVWLLIAKYIFNFGMHFNWNCLRKHEDENSKMLVEVSSTLDLCASKRMNEAADIVNAFQCHCLNAVTKLEIVGRCLSAKRPLKECITRVRSEPWEPADPRLTRCDCGAKLNELLHLAECLYNSNGTIDLSLVGCALNVQSTSALYSSSLQTQPSRRMFGPQSMTQQVRAHDEQESRHHTSCFQKDVDDSILKLVKVFINWFSSDLKQLIPEQVNKWKNMFTFFTNKYIS